MPNLTAAAMTMSTSLSISALPISMEVRLAKISATMSVPPVDAPISNTMAEPSAGSSTAKISSSSVSPVMGALSGHSLSHSETKKDRANEE